MNVKQEQIRSNIQMALPADSCSSNYMAEVEAARITLRGK